MTKTEVLVEHAVVTFFEAAIAYIIVIPTINWGKTAVAGAIGAGLSAVYNMVRQSNPPVIETPTVQTTPVVTPTVEPPLNGVEQLTPVIPPAVNIPVTTPEDTPETTN